MKEILTFDTGSGLFEFNTFSVFPENLKPKVLESLAKTAETIIERGEAPLWDSLTSYVEASYNFARSIDPTFKTWKERGMDLPENLETYKYLIDYYEMIRGKSRLQILEALAKLKDLETK